MSKYTIQLIRTVVEGCEVEIEATSLLDAANRSDKIQDCFNLPSSEEDSDAYPDWLKLAINDVEKGWLLESEDIEVEDVSET